MLVHYTPSAQPPSSNLSSFPRLQEGMCTLAIQNKTKPKQNTKIKQKGLTLMNQDLYLTTPNSVLEITELGGSKRQPSGMRAFHF